MVIKDWDGMKVRGPNDTVYVTSDDSVGSIKIYVKDEDENILFETEGYKDDEGIHGVAKAIQWAIDYQSSEQKANMEVSE